MKPFFYLVVLLSIAIPSVVHAQYRSSAWEAAPTATLFETPASEADIADVDFAQARAFGFEIHPLLRTIAMVGAATGGYALGDAQFEQSTGDVQYYPAATGSSASALTGIMLSSGSPVRVVLGAALAALPATAVSTFVDGLLEDGESEDLPMYLFGVTQGLFGSAFAQNR